MAKLSVSQNAKVPPRLRTSDSNIAKTRRAPPVTKLAIIGLANPPGRSSWTFGDLKTVSEYTIPGSGLPCRLALH